jgi:hypothetical protein
LGSELNGDFDGKLMNDNANSTKAARSVKCAFCGISCLCNECLDQLLIANNVGKNKIDLDDSFNNRDIAQIRICADDHAKDGTTSKALHVIKLKQFLSGQEYLMRAHFGLPSISREKADGGNINNSSGGGGGSDMSWKKLIRVEFLKYHVTLFWGYNAPGIIFGSFLTTTH